MARTESARHGARRTLAAITTMAALGATACMGSVNRVYEDDASLAPDATSASAEDGSFDASASSDADAPNDAVSDVAPAEAAPEEAGNTADATPEAEAGQVYTCNNGEPVSSCAQCGTDTTECVYCAQDGGHPGVCGPKNTYCNNSAPSGAAVCTCSGTSGASTCVASFQVCAVIGFGPTEDCQTCGEPGSNGHSCKGGGTCDQTTGTCN